MDSHLDTSTLHAAASEQLGANRNPLPIVVGIGGSAGALPALIRLLQSLEEGAPLAIVVVLHLSPDHQSSATEILQRATSLTVSQVRERTRLQPGHVYVIAPGTNLVTDDGHIQPAAAPSKRPSSVIDLFFRSLAEAHGPRAVGIVLSGTGRDGSLGLSQINESGGLAMAQAPEDAEHGDMPLAAIATGAVDLVLPASEIGKRLVELTRFQRSSPAEAERALSIDPAVEPKSNGEVSPGQALNDILVALRARTRHDFRRYKTATVLRRVERRMQVNRLASIQEYRDFVREKPEEMAPLLADMLISVTNFFRDPVAFEVLQHQVIPKVMEAAGEGEEVRVWIPACASGEEAYSVAILLQEFADLMKRPPRLQLFASDINDPAVAIARAGIYAPNVAADVSESRLLAYFDKDESGYYRVRSSLRETIVFAHHNVLSDPPFSRLDLICCRNLLIYLDRSAQAALLESFAYALKPGGYLFLGNAESIDVAGATFESVSKEHRIYRLRTDAVAANHPRVPSQLQLGGPPVPAALPASLGRGSFNPATEDSLEALHRHALAAAALPNVLINGQYELERVSNGASRFVAFAEGAPTRDVLSNVASDIRLELRTALYQAGQTQRSVRTVFRRGAGEADGQASAMALTVHPVPGQNGNPHWLVLFDEQEEDGLVAGQPGTALGDAHEATIRRLEDENRALKANLQDTLDRSAVSTEELKASNEELQAINEELRSAKEELETSKEELQSVNEELTTVNFELRLKVEEAGRNNDDLRNLMEAAEIATVFVDAGMRVMRFTPQASNLFSLIPTDVGRPLMDVKNRLRYDEIVDDATLVFKQLRPLERSITSIDDQHFLARVLPYRTSTDRIGGAVLTFIDVTRLHRAETTALLAEQRLRDAVAASEDFAVICTDSEGVVTSWNEGAMRIFGHEGRDIVGRAIDLIYTAQDRTAGVPALERGTALREGRATDERWHVRADGSTLFCSGVMTPLPRRDEGFVKIARDVSLAKGIELEQQEALTVERRSVEDARSSAHLRDRFLAVMSHELKQPLNLIQVNAELLTRLPELHNSGAAQRIGSTIMRAVAAQETIVNDLLDLSRVRTGKLQLHREPTEIVDVVRELVQAMSIDAERKRITLNLKADDAVLCDCDPVRFEQIVWNLLGNALKFTPENGRVDVEVTVDGPSAKLVFKDTGAGIAAEYLPHLFELFSQGTTKEGVRSRRGGLGIGLSLVRDLVEAHGGHIHASSPGERQGTTFTVWLPLAARAPQRIAQASAFSFSGCRVLMVDDEPDSLATFAMLLELEGAQVETTTSARTALDLLASHDFDLLVSDIGMPEMSGLELMQRASALRPAKSFRSVAVSGYGSEADVQASRDAGFDAHISKPASLEKLRVAVAGLPSRLTQ